MKYTFSILVILILSITSCSSTKSMNDFYAKYDKQATVIPLPKFAVNLAKKNSNAKILEYIKSAKVFIISDAGQSKQNRVMKDLSSATKGDNYEQMVKMNVRNSKINAAYLQENGNVNQLILGVNGLRNILVIDSKVQLSEAELEEALSNIDISDLEDILK